MEGKSRNKNVLRSLMKDALMKKETRINSPLVRYNDVGQAVCKVCNVVIKSEGLWLGHISSKGHKEAVEELKRRAKKATAVANQAEQAAPPLPAEEASSPVLPATREASALPEGFFDTPPPKKQRADSSKSQPSREQLASRSGVRLLPEAGAASLRSEGAVSVGEAPPSGSGSGSGSGRANGSESGSALPEGFFDSKEADHKARGVQLPKIDIQEELKEFQKAVDVDLEEVDIRQEEDEAEAADEREMREELTQRSLLERVQELKQKKEQRAAALAQAQASQSMQNEGSGTEAGRVEEEEEEKEEEEEEEEDEDEDGVFGLLDWRAKHY